MDVKHYIKKLNIRTRHDGRLEGRITVGGKQKSFYGNTKAEIKDAAQDYLLKVERGYRDPERVVFNDFIEYWLQEYKYGHIKDSTYTRIYSVYKSQIKDDIGCKLIGKITSRDIQELINEHANPTQTKTQPLAISGLKRLYQLINASMNVAVAEHVISENPCNGVRLPNEEHVLVETREQFTMSDNDLKAFKEAALSKYKTTGDYKSRDALVLLILVNLGLRAGEMLALEWSDLTIGEDFGMVDINKTVQSNVLNFSGTGRKIYDKVDKKLKTKAAKRKVPLSAEVVSYLKELKEYDIRHGINSPYICASGVGTRVSARNLQRSLKRLLNKTDIAGNVTLHTLRHTFGSKLLRDGVNIEIISKLMGHANVSVTYNKYIHVLDEQKVEVMKNRLIC